MDSTNTDHRMLTRAFICMIMALMLAACGKHAQEPDTVAYQQAVHDWQDQRLKNLTGADGWTTLVGLYWLKSGDNSFGRDAGNSIVMDYATLPARVGSFTVTGKDVGFTAAPGVQVLHDGKPVTALAQLVSDVEDNTTVLQVGSISFYMVERGDRLGIRVKDSQADARVHFKGLQYFPIDPKWRLQAKFEPYRPMKQVPIINILGMQEDMDSPGALLFNIAGRDYRLETVLEPGETDYFVMVADSTNGKQTYGAGRFLYVHPPKDGKTLIDFNKAYNPPCAFTHFATCPLPPPQNRLPLAVSAGELKYLGSDH